MKRKIILLLALLCFMFTSCNDLVNSAMSLNDKEEQSDAQVIGKQQSEDFESENGSDEPISKSVVQQQEQQNQEITDIPTVEPQPVQNNNQIATKEDDFEVSIASYDVSRKELNNGNVFYEALGFDSDKNLVIRYATAVAYSNINDADANNDSMRVTIEAFDSSDDMLWKEQQEFSNYESTELGDFSVLMIDKKGNLIIENLSYNSSSTLRCLSFKDGNVKWAADAFSVSIKQDSEGNYYYATYYGKNIICLNSEGDKKWSVDFSNGDTYFWPSILLKGDSIIVSCTELTNNGEQSAKLQYDMAGKFIQKLE